MHTSYPKGTPLHIIMKDGRIVTGRFSDHKSGRVLLENGEAINIAEVRAMSIRKLIPTEAPRSKKKIIFRIN